MKRRRWGGIFLIGGIVFLLLLWLVYWYGASQIAAAVRDRVTVAADARGYTVECAEEIGGGFPLSVDLACGRASLSEKTGNRTAVLHGFAATTPLYRPGRIEWEATGPFMLDAPTGGLGLTATWARAETSIDTGIGGLSAIAGDVQDVSLFVEPHWRTGAFEGIDLESADFTVSPGPDDSYLLSTSARALAFETGDGRNLPTIDFDTEIAALDFGDSIGFDPRAALNDWRARGGALRIDEMTVTAGTVSTRSSGNLLLSPSGMISGDLTVEIVGIETLPDLVEAFRPGSREKVSQITAAATAFTRPVETPDGTARQMTLNIRDSVVSIGIIPIGVLPTIPF